MKGAVQRGRARLPQHPSIDAITAVVVRSHRRVAATTHSVRNIVYMFISLPWKVLCSEDVLGCPNTRPLMRSLL